VKDYYRVLGVLDDAEDIIIRAAYKALAQRYHPDKWSGDREQANNKMSEINEAYEVLSDPSRRKKYDEEYFRFRAKNESTDTNDDETNFVSEEDENWQMAIDFFPKLRNDYDELSKYSKILANTYRVIIIESKNFKDSSHLKNSLQSEYFSRYYGKNTAIHAFAKNLLVNGESKPAIELNKIVRYMGDSVNEDQVVSRMLRKFTHLRETDFYSIGYYKERLINKSITPNEITVLLENPAIGARNISISDYGSYIFFIGSSKLNFTREQVIDWLIQKLMDFR
jgi:curved DNA-binding protein CbpA